MADKNRNWYGTPFPAIEGCPECGEERFAAIQNTKEGVSLTLDGSGGIAQIRSDDIIDSAFSFVECKNCRETIVLDGEVVHDEVDA